MKPLRVTVTLQNYDAAAFAAYRQQRNLTSAPNSLIALMILQAGLAELRGSGELQVHPNLEKDKQAIQRPKRP